MSHGQATCPCARPCEHTELRTLKETEDTWQCHLVVCHTRLRHTPVSLPVWTKIGHFKATVLTFSISTCTQHRNTIIYPTQATNSSQNHVLNIIYYRKTHLHKLTKTTSFIDLLKSTTLYMHINIYIIHNHISNYIIANSTLYMPYKPKFTLQKLPD